ncbi:MAG TPA: molybdopterin molybdotransferase MoeA [Anaerolineae bacterium]|nr:molybdopterin molybdotransferase MoeA [Anaerolineae bacterium]HNT04725.1 molybdopterin molybdotransferase MoeA [Anaerolineae bacterium]
MDRRVGVEKRTVSERGQKGQPGTDLYPMLSVEEATEQLLAYFQTLEPETVPLLESLGRVLAEDVYADVDIPPLSNTAMDGYALRAADTAGASGAAPVELRIVADLAAGYVSEVPVVPGTAIRIMTGAPIPEGADAVLPFEDAERNGKVVRIVRPVQLKANVRDAGEDVHKGELVLHQGRRIRPQDVGMLATVGRRQVQVTRRPRVAILATGDEVVEVDAPLGPGKIRNSNSYSNAAQVLAIGGVPVLLGIAHDQVEDLTAKIRQGLAQKVDLFLTSGGVSVGHFDVVKQVLAAEGEMTFWRVRMKPGKPLAFGRIGGVPLLGLPGNPVSAMVSFELFARAAILKMLGQRNGERPSVEAALVDGMKSKDGRRHFVRVRVEEKDGAYQARLTGDQGSGRLSTMVEANGLAIIPEEWSSAPPGSKVRVMMLEGDL